MSHIPHVFASGSDKIDAQLRKVFVGGLPHNLELSQFRAYFCRFGEIDDIVILQDKRTQRPRGFGFVTYGDIRSVNTVLKMKDSHQIEGKWIDVKSAVPVQQMKEVLLSHQMKSSKKEASKAKPKAKEKPIPEPPELS